MYVTMETTIVGVAGS